jgi:hypothetical protein
MFINNVRYLADGYSPELVAQIQKSHQGQAHFAGTGPFAATCGDCVHLGYYRQVHNGAGDTIRTQRVGGCAEFHRLTGKHGPAVPRHAEACRYFRRND